MTNFDKWKEGLTIYDVTVTEDGLLVSKDAATKLFEAFRKYTKEIDSDFGYVQSIEDWANSPAEDSEPAPLTSTVVWHRFPNELPPERDDNEFLVAAISRKDNTAFVRTDEWDYDFNCWYDMDNDQVTHWAELPEPPKE